MLVRQSNSFRNRLPVNLCDYRWGGGVFVSDPLFKALMPTITIWQPPLWLVRHSEVRKVSNTLICTVASFIFMCTDKYNSMNMFFTHWNNNLPSPHLACQKQDSFLSFPKSALFPYDPLLNHLWFVRNDLLITRWFQKVKWVVTACFHIYVLLLLSEAIGSNQSWKQVLSVHSRATCNATEAACFALQLYRLFLGLVVDWSSQQNKLSELGKTSWGLKH